MIEDKDFDKVADKFLFKLYDLDKIDNSLYDVHRGVGSKLKPPISKDDSERLGDNLASKGFLKIRHVSPGPNFESFVEITELGRTYVRSRRSDPTGLKTDFETRKFDLLWDSIKVITGFLIGIIIGFITGYLSHH